MTSSAPVLTDTTIAISISGIGMNPADIFGDFVFDDPGFPFPFSSITIPTGQTSGVFYFRTSQPASLGVGREFIVEIGGVDPAEIDVGSVTLSINDDFVIDLSEAATGSRFDFDGNPGTAPEAAANSYVRLDHFDGSIQVNDGFNQLEFTVPSLIGNSPAGITTIVGTSGTDTIDIQIERTLEIATGAGQDFIFAGGGNETIDGGADGDFVSYDYASAAVTIDLSLQTAQMTGGSGIDTGS